MPSSPRSPPQCVKLIYAYMGFAGFSIFFVLTGVIALELLQKWDVHTGARGCAGLRCGSPGCALRQAATQMPPSRSRCADFISFTYILFNFAVGAQHRLFLVVGGGRGS